MGSTACRMILGVLLATGCTSHEAAKPGTEPVVPRPAPAPTAPFTPTPEVAVAQCVLQAIAIDPPVLHRDLLAVAPQYFHPPHRGGFDAYRGGGRVFPWFDAYALQEPFIPPEDVRIAASTRSTLLAVSSDGELGVIARDGGAPTWLGERLYPEDAFETTAGMRWVLARSGSTWRLVQIDAGNRASVFDLKVPESTWDVRIALTADDRIAVAWLERDGGSLRVKLTLDPIASEPMVVDVDEVVLPEAVAALSQRSTVDLALAGDGPDGVAIAWRPLADAGYADVGDRGTPPQTPCGAEVRWLAVSSDGKPSGSPRRHSTLAHPLGGVSGIGPWGLTGNGMKATRIGGRAAFVWLDDGGVQGARVDHEAATVLATRESAPLIFLQREGQMLLLDSSPGVRAFSLGCE